MSDTKRQFANSLAKGLLAGLIGGLAGAVAKSISEKVYPPQMHGELEPAVAGHELARQVEAQEQGIHWGLGALSGAAYGALVEFYPAATAKDGAGFGMTLASLAHESALPATGLAAEVEERTERERTSEMASYVIFGVVTETIRRVVRPMLG